MTDIFISYRRQDSSKIAHKIHQDLCKVYGTEQIYLDVHNNKPGDVFPEEIRQALNSAKVILVIIGQQWVDIADLKGKRLFQEKDFVRKEVSSALEKNRISATLIPILVNKTQMPQKDQLPPLLEELATIQGLSIRTHGKQYDEGIQSLITHIHNALTLYTKTPSTPSIPPPPPQLPKKGLWGRFISQSWGIIFIQFFIGIILVGIIIPFIPEEIRDSVWHQLFPQQNPENNFVPPFLVNTETFSVDRIAQDPSGLLIAPSRAGLALWGYSDAESTLFALDIATGQALEIWDAPSDQDATRYPFSELYDRAVITALYYDGKWLWVGDSRHNRLIAFNPLALDSEVIIYEFGDSGDPTAIFNTQNTLWVALRDSQELVSLLVNHADERIQPKCRMTLSGIPRIIASYTPSAILVVTESDTTLTEVDRQSCETIVRPIPDIVPKALLSFDNTHYLMAETSLYQILDAGRLQPVDIPVEEKPTIQLAISQNQFIWFTTTSNKLFAFNIETQKIVYETTLNNSPTHLMSSNTQVWFVHHPNQVTRYVIPYHIYPSAQYLVEYRDDLWILDDKSQLCRMNNPTDCKPININDSPISAISLNINQDNLWIGTENGEIWSMNLETNEIISINHVVHPDLPISFMNMSIAQSSERDLWVTNGTDTLAMINLDTEEHEVVYPLDNTQTLTPPNHIAFGDNRLWFVYYNSSEINIQEASFSEGIIRLELPTITVPNNQYINIGTSTLKVQDNRLYFGVLGGLYSYDMDGNNLSTLGVDSNISDIALVEDTIWILNHQNGFLFSFPAR